MARSSEDSFSYAEVKCSIILPFYRQPNMLAKQLENWSKYSKKAREHFTLIVIDDGSPELAVIHPTQGVRLYRVAVDIPWHRNPCRNLGAHVAETPWIIQTDIDHVLSPGSADALLETEVSEKYWYRFPRWRVGRADETRKKDAIPDDCQFGRVKEHIDSYLITRELFMRSPYDDDYQGFLGGGSPFLARMLKIAPVKVLPDDVCLHVYTRHAVSDSSVTALSRDTSRYAKLRKEKERTGNTVPKNTLYDSAKRFEWGRVL